MQPAIAEPLQTTPCDRRAAPRAGGQEEERGLCGVGSQPLDRTAESCAMDTAAEALGAQLSATSKELQRVADGLATQVSAALRAEHATSLENCCCAPPAARDSLRLRMQA